MPNRPHIAAGLLAGALTLLVPSGCGDDVSDSGAPPTAHDSTTTIRDESLGQALAHGTRATITTSMARYAAGSSFRLLISAPEQANYSEEVEWQEQRGGQWTTTLILASKPHDATSEVFSRPSEPPPGEEPPAQDLIGFGGAGFQNVEVPADIPAGRYRLLKSFNDLAVASPYVATTEIDVTGTRS